MKLLDIESVGTQEFSLSTASSDALSWPAQLGHASALLLRMFRDPRVLEAEERHALIAKLRDAVELEPHVPEIRVLLGMALCVDLRPQEALEQLRHASQQAPDCFIARLKFGELLMRLRICNQAADETQAAARLAVNAAQAELARKQAATIRTMLREGIERGGYGGMLSRLIPFRRKQGRMKTAMLAETR
jgi:hypothetical protein